MSESTFGKIIRKTGRKPVECRCERCRTQCKTPCLGTPEDILRLIEAGYGDRLAITEWAVGILHGKLDRPVLMVQAIQTEEGCTFFHNGLCELHTLGLKPTEGKLSHHTIKPENYNFSKWLPWQVAKVWLSAENQDVIERVFSYFK